MRDVNGNDLKIGSKIKLAMPDPGYTIGVDNPKVGTKWECVGTYRGGGSVNWENGAHNSYKDGELVPAEPYIDLWYSI